jgi:hypothetical protein
VTRQHLSMGETDGTPGCIEQQASEPSASACLPAHWPPHLARLAELVADGEAEFPFQMSEQDAEQLRRLIRQRLRERLMRYIARQIAVDLHNSSRNTE